MGMDNLTRLITHSLLLQKQAPYSKMGANHATNYSYINCSLCIINYLFTSSTAIDTLKHKMCHSCVGIHG